MKMAKIPTAAVAREILRREKGYAPDPNINLSDYGYDEKTTPAQALADAAKLNNTPATDSATPSKDERLPYKAPATGENATDYKSEKSDADKYKETSTELFDKIMAGDNPYYSDAEALDKPEYVSVHDEKINTILEQILNGEKFEYDVNEDALFQNYSDIYERNARAAAENTMGNAMAASGGYGNSYAAALAGQAYNAQMQGLNEIVPDLQQLAYEQYMANRQDQYNQLNVLNAMEQQDYSQYRDDVSDFYTDKEMLIGMGDRYNGDLYNQFNAATALENEAYDREYQAERDAVGDAQWRENFEYGKEQDALDREYQAERDAVSDAQWRESFEYGKEQDALDREMNDAIAAAELGDFSLIGNLLGIDTASAEQWFNMQKGMELYSATGLVDYLKDAGVDTSLIEENMKNEKFVENLSVALSVYEATGSPKLLQALGIDTSYMDQILKYGLMDAEKSANGGGGSTSTSNVDYDEDDDPIADMAEKCISENGTSTWDSQAVSDFFKKYCKEYGVEHNQENYDDFLKLVSIGLPQSHRG